MVELVEGEVDLDFALGLASRGAVDGRAGAECHRAPQGAPEGLLDGVDGGLSFSFEGEGAVPVGEGDPEAAVVGEPGRLVVRVVVSVLVLDGEVAEIDVGAADVLEVELRPIMCRAGRPGCS